MRATGHFGLVFLLLLAAPSVGKSQTPAVPPMPRLLSADRLRVAEYRLASGRIAATANASLGTTRVERRRERLLIQAAAAQVTFSFESNDAGQQLAIALSAGNQLSIRRERAEPKYSLEFEQDSDEGDEGLSLVVRTADAKYDLHGKSLWHLYLEQPELMRQHLFPLLELLRPSWQLAPQAAAVEDTLVRRAPGTRPWDAPQWTAWVAELGDAKFTVRQEAERLLLSAGPVVAPFLQGLSRKNLDAEQYSRVRNVLDALLDSYEDTVDQTSTWLASDLQVWLSLAARPDPLKRRIAAEQLANLLGEKIDFDAAADDEVRSAQLQRLRERIVRD